tara:strand:- start:6077 stop:6559 length:483 start_codon:yes stop_codon:yes gene_type:complete
MVLGGQIFALGVIFWGVEGSSHTFIKGDPALYRRMGRDIFIELTDCGTEEYYCREDVTGFQIVVPMDLWAEYRWPNGEIYAETDRFTYRLLADYPGNFSDQRIFTMSREGPDGNALRYQISRDCGVSYLEFSAAELPHFYEQPVPANNAFYISRCEGSEE